MAWKTKEPVGTEIEPGRKYTPSELDEIATAILREDAKENPIKEHPKILFEEHIRNRWRREVQTSVGTPDPSIVQGVYYRSHPEGRKINSDEARKRHGAGFTVRHKNKKKSIFLCLDRFDGRGVIVGHVRKFVMMLQAASDAPTAIRQKTSDPNA